jgi:hypothetical protein
MVGPIKRVYCFLTLKFRKTSDDDDDGGKIDETSDPDISVSSMNLEQQIVTAAVRE